MVNHRVATSTGFTGWGSATIDAQVLPKSRNASYRSVRYAGLPYNGRPSSHPTSSCWPRRDRRVYERLPARLEPQARRSPSQAEAQRDDSPTSSAPHSSTSIPSPPPPGCRRNYSEPRARDLRLARDPLGHPGWIETGVKFCAFLARHAGSNSWASHPQGTVEPPPDATSGDHVPLTRRWPRRRTPRRSHAVAASAFAAAVLPLAHPVRGLGAATLKAQGMPAIWLRNRPRLQVAR